MRFVDASVFLYAYLKPKRTMPHGVAEMKRAAKAIVTTINGGENAASRLTHISEVAKILEAVMSLEESHKIVRDLIHATTISLFEPTRVNYVDAIEIAENSSVRLNGALAYVLMRTQGVEEIYSFDRDFDKFRDIKRVYSWTR